MTTLTLVFNEPSKGHIRISAFPADNDESTDLERNMANRSSDIIKETFMKGGAK